MSAAMALIPLTSLSGESHPVSPKPSGVINPGVSPFSAGVSFSLRFKDLIANG